MAIRIRVRIPSFPRVRRFFNTSFATIAILLVLVLSAFASLRIAIHGREVAVPNLAGLSDAEAAEAVDQLGLNLTVENRFYSAGVTPNHVLSQLPVAGSRVRRGWQVRVTESLGGQKLAVPDVTGQQERPASLQLRRLQLEVGTVAHLPAPSPGGVILAQSPPPNTAGLDGPRVALLVSDDETSAANAAYVMPAIGGLNLSTAMARLATAGLRITTAAEPMASAEPAAGAGPGDQPAPVYCGPSQIIISQSPQPGHRVSRADSIRVVCARAATGL